MSSSIVHEQDHLRFVVYSPEKQQLGYLSYEQREHGATTVLDLQHTVVDPAGRGQGLAGKLCDAAFTFAQEQGYKVIPTCSYISDTYLKRTSFPNALELVYKTPEDASAL
ncbi:unnamed protein product [Aphanomyces euteiches]|uniref:Uncharacterized protein n=1 Tax=Aphanomyces euteiches TaxID=100861 RepID=A0A6G0XAQ5_9STRA|nr:hypothetical protein Ae201684_006416 [Aphanomyces euteiches]KAH9091090.1 hypothetical protein Ae201684P_006491 [Aphanomyces euteiches]KAH9146427.1 hypothetical protein AeRB84_009687 [Aphanomyces euteiches]